MNDRQSIKSIALFAPNRSALYINGLLGMRKQFVRRGIDCHVGWSYLDNTQLPQFCDVFRPDAILEIDRTRNNAPNMPENVLSIAWLQDWRSMGEDKVGNSNDGFGGSDLYYFCARPDTIGANVSELKHWNYLLQATDPEIYYPEAMDWESDFSLMGYIPPKEALEKIDHPLLVQIPGEEPNTTDFGTIRQLINALQARGLTWNHYDAARARQEADAYIRGMIKKKDTLLSRLKGALHSFTLGGKETHLIPDGMMYFVENEVMRAQARSAVAEAVLAVSRSLRLYGLGMWQTYPEYAPYYKGPVLLESEVRRIYGSSRVNLHNAMTQMHARVLDCMACGSTIMVNKMLHNDASQPDCLRAHFEPGVHYFEYDEEDLTEQARAVLADEPGRRRAGEEAAKLVRAKHTWSHRVDQILSDIADMRGA